MSLVQHRASLAAAAVLPLAALVSFGGTEAAVGRERLQDFVAATPVVVLAEVTSVEGLPQGDWKATGRVVEVWKGPQRDVVSYGPAGHGDVAGCEGSAARVGETVVLFLEPERNRISELLRIAFVGYGRLPVYTVEGKRFVESSAFFLPAGVQPTQALVGDHTRELVRLDWLRGFVTASVLETSKDGR